jgi:NADPH:quinone reductase-like Zn-dependent oxidoreductase
MQAIVYREFGSPDVLRMEEMEKPAPGNGEVLIKVRAAGLNPLDWKLMKGRPWVLRLVMGLHKAKHPGVDVAGEIESVGSGVTEFKPGDMVFGACRGALAAYVCAPASGLALRPDHVTFEEAASVPIAAWTALQGLRDKGHIQPGQETLINGAAGGVGTFAVQIAKHLGAEVTGVCSTKNIELVRSIGADHVIDYTQQRLLAGNRRYDLILECVGNLSLPEVRRLLNPGGRCVMVGARPDVGLLTILAGILKLLVSAPFMKQKILTFMAKRNKDDLAFLAELMESGKVKPVIERSYELGEVQEAIRHLEQGHARGKVVVTVARTPSRETGAD